MARRRLNYYEIAALESLRSVKPGSAAWRELTMTLAELEHKGRIRLDRVSRVAGTEPARVRNAARMLDDALKHASAA